MSETTRRQDEGDVPQTMTVRSGAGGLRAGGADAGRSGVTLYRGGHVYSPGSPRATALLVHGTDVAWVGEEAAAAGLSAATTVDLQGAFVAPAFVDAHVPLPAAGLLAQALDLGLTVSPAHALAEIEQAATAANDPDVLIAGGCPAARWPEGRLPTPRELDVRAHGRPVYLLCPDPAAGLPTSGIASIALLRAVPDAGLDPAGDGIAAGAAHELIWAGLVAAAGRQQRLGAYRAARTAAARAGLAAVHSFAPPGPAGAGIAAELAELAELVRQGADDHDDRPAALIDGPVFRAVDVPETGAVDSIAAVIAAASRAGVQTCWVARQARAVADVVAGTARAAEEVGPATVRASAHRIEGIQSVDERDLARLGELGLVVVACPRVLQDGPPLAALAAAGVPLALGGGTVSVPYPFDPWATIRAAVGPAASGPSLSSVLSPRAAFAASTRGGWRAARQDGDGSGQLVPGSPATLAIWEIQGDLAVRAPDSRVAAWSTDPRSGVGGLPDLDGPAPRCLRTLLRGDVLYDAGALGPL